MRPFLTLTLLSGLGNFALWFFGWQLSDAIQFVLCPPLILVFVPLVLGNAIALRWTLKERRLLWGHILGATLAAWGILLVVGLLVRLAPPQ